MEKTNYLISKEWKKRWMIVLPTEAFRDYVNHDIVKRLYLTDIGFFPFAKNHYRERKEGIEEFIFIYCMNGKGSIEIGGHRYYIKENEAFCIPRFSGHAYYADEKDPWSILWVHFKGEDADYYPLNEKKIVGFEDEYSSNRMLFLFESLYQVLKGNYSLGNFIYITQVLSLLLSQTYQIEGSERVEKQNTTITNVIRYMYDHMHESLKLEDLCEVFYMSKSYMNAIFQEYTKQAPLEFFTHLKMKEACKLFKSTDMYIYEVARDLGYKDQYYFSRIFKKVVGISPKEYKQGNYYFE